MSGIIDPPKTIVNFIAEVRLLFYQAIHTILI